jgi:hypothetical protein
MSDDVAASVTGQRFARRSWGCIAVTTVLLLSGLAAVRVAADGIRHRRTQSQVLEHTEQQIEQATRITADRAVLQGEVEELRRRRSEHTRMLWTGDLDPALEERGRALCEDAELRFEGLTLHAVRRRGALDARPCQLAFAGTVQQVPVLVDAVDTQPELVWLTGLDLEVVNFIDDRITGVIAFEVFGLRAPPPPDGQILRPFLPLSSSSAGVVQPRGTAGDQLAEARARLASEYAGLIDYEALTATRDHLAAEATELERLTAARPPFSDDLARAVPTLTRNLQRSALGRAGLRVEPGGAVEFLSYD